MKIQVPLFSYNVGIVVLKVIYWGWCNRMPGNENIVWALILTTLAGLSTTVGSIISIYYREPGPRFMAFTMGFSAGVMILVSFGELLPQGVEALGFRAGYLAFFAGIVIIFAIDLIIPHSYIMESHPSIKEVRRGRGGSGDGEPSASDLRRADLFVALGIGIHNFPEGMATLASALNDIDTGIAMAVAIAIHNIPEGAAVAVPVYATTKSRSKAFKWSFLSGLSEPLGALLALLVLMPFLSEAVLGWMLSAVAGFMVFIALDELLPIAKSYKTEHIAIVGVICGMLVMFISLDMLR